MQIVIPPADPHFSVNCMPLSRSGSFPNPNSCEYRHVE
jgi:hypothetical protein